VRLWIDECLSPTLVGVAQRRYEATCNEYRGLLHAKDPVLYAVVSQEEWVFVTNNERDFRALTAREGLHSGLILLPQRVAADQRLMLEAVLDYIGLHSAKADMLAAAWMTNRVVEYNDEDDTVSASEWPPSRP
jgi:predicted nuclease of predicted toxin-antitoxin system